jgi:ferredoxin-NADP reductase
MAYHYYDCIVTDVVDETPGVKRFFIKFPDEVSLQFKPGQFIMLDLPIESKITNRSYSIASPPGEDNSLELLIVLNPQGLGTPHLFDNIIAGSSIRCTLPIGKFSLPEILDSDVMFICTGTGVAPFRSMILDTIQKNKPFKKLILVMGVRHEADLMYRKEFEELAQNVPGFEYIPVLSRATSDTWQGKTGYVHQVYRERFKEPTNTLFYLCGWAAMLKEARESLQQIVYDRKQIKFESYD